MSPGEKMPFRRIRIIALLQLLVIGVPFHFADAGMFDKLNSLVSSPNPDSDAASGLKEALGIGIDAAIRSAGRKGGFSDNPAIKIPFPKKLAVVEDSFRKVGLDPVIDQFEFAMNHAAESAVPPAKELLLKALKKMRFEDARQVLEGGDTSATRYFREKTSGALIEALKPEIQRALNKDKVSQQLDDLVKRYQTITLSGRPGPVPLDLYVTEQTINGLFTLIAEEERRIRNDPAARPTELLKTVFAPKPFPSAR